MTPRRKAWPFAFVSFVGLVLAVAGYAELLGRPVSPLAIFCGTPVMIAPLILYRWTPDEVSYPALWRAKETRTLILAFFAGFALSVLGVSGVFAILPSLLVIVLASVVMVLSTRWLADRILP